MINDLVSIIVPVEDFNKFPQKTIDSIINQSYNNIEIIIVVSDATQEQRYSAKELQKDIPRLRFEFVESCNFLAKRNHGIRCCYGKYIAFVDEGDIIEPEMIRTMFTAMEKNEAQLCICNAIRERNGESHLQFNHKDAVIPLDDKEEYIISYMLRPVHAYCVWNKMYKASLVRENLIHFNDEKEIYPEDMDFNLRYISFCNKVVWLGEPLYRHIVNIDENTDVHRENIVRRYINCCNEYRKFLMKNELIDKLENVYYMMLNWNIINSVQSAVRDNKETNYEIYTALEDALKTVANIKNILVKKYYSSLALNYNVNYLVCLGKYEKYVKKIRELMENGKVDDLFIMKKKFNLKDRLNEKEDQKTNLFSLTSDIKLKFFTM
ncbi:MAG: glycosyltransferase family 2 protein [Firmicutes bacterium]|nr:glycosyltransferase family 2 protein [Bacillota bacterium]